MKKFLTLLAALVCILVLAEVGVYSDKIVVGSFQALSGSYAIIGQEMSKGMKAYFNWVNKNSGVYGRKIELIIADDQLNPSKTVVEVKRLVESDKVFAIVGGLGTYGCLAVMDYLEQNKVPFVYQGAGTSLLVMPPKKYIFGVQPDYTLEGQLIAKFLVKELGKKKIAILYMANDIGKEGYAAALSRLQSYNLKPVVEISYNPAETDYSALAVDVLNANPEAIIIYGLITDTIRWIKTLRDYGVTSDIVTIYPNADPSLVTLGGKYVEGIYLTGWVPLATPDKPEFVRDYERAVAIFQETYPKEIPSSYAVAGFIAAEVFVQGLLRAGSDLTREGLVKALETFDHWNGILAKDITWGPNLRRGKSSMYFIKIENGVFVPVTDLISLQD
ncbi:MULTISPECIES: ABC transporter substrate-binding protein [Pseudothermotoga]|jgi:branched-chain amino acid transport system substrate-binding protein|uniref:ABC transporter substrate-binding protein n=1 Tax=Pseudothermotoga TaxID=1643951 RepID=UPI00041EAD24|nr:MULTISPECIES: ABC transporter substrate-binding protein [Pseudothermotoga]KUK20040.1 MAG: Extracellular ligand-binding receptor [Pseudothermotoga lettingae]MDI3495184.1 branched-chain amino acid transport system substrate-binding protein [Pseudothermotoga sp.]MDK2883714.1 branched-chain amino acid transport system substrate-binding protein [Pseudothermotoga sp.]HBT25859.1 ABC transporter substrate-binding protein [Pseudothermotoga sp.]